MGWFSFSIGTNVDLDNAVSILEDIPKKWVKNAAVDKGYDDMHKYLLNASRQLFVSMGETGKHGKWVKYQKHEKRYLAVKISYLQWADARYLLQWGRLERRLGNSLFEKSHPDHVWDVRTDKRGAVFGTKVPYAANHQHGQGQLPKWARMKSGSIRIPQRRVIDLNDRQIRDIRDRIMYRAIWNSWDSMTRAAFTEGRLKRM